MLLYDIFYHGNSMDTGVPLPDATPEIRYAQCVNGADARLVPVKVNDLASVIAVISAVEIPTDEIRLGVLNTLTRADYDDFRAAVPAVATEHGRIVLQWIRAGRPQVKSWHEWQ